MLLQKVEDSKDELNKIDEFLEEELSKRIALQEEYDGFLIKQNTMQEELNNISLEVHKVEIEKDQLKNQKDKEVNSSEAIC